MGRKQVLAFLFRGAVVLGSLKQAHATTSSDSETCQGGIAGIEDTARRICCVLACGQCGGVGCGDIEGLTENECCSSSILASGSSCGDTGAAPCIVSEPEFTPSTCPNGLPGVSSGEVCCAEDCNLQCGGEGCSSIPGTNGASDCCSTTILAEGENCGDGVEAPCIMIEGTFEDVATPAPVITTAPSAADPTADPTMAPVSVETPAPTESEATGGTPPTAAPDTEPAPNTAAPATPTPQEGGETENTPAPSSETGAIPSSSSTSAPSSLSMVPSSGSSSSSRITGVVVGAVVATAVVLLLVALCIKRRRSTATAKKKGTPTSRPVEIAYDPEAARSSTVPRHTRLEPAATGAVSPLIAAMSRKRIAVAPTGIPAPANTVGPEKGKRSGSTLSSARAGNEQKPSLTPAEVRAAESVGVGAAGAAAAVSGVVRKDTSASGSEISDCVLARASNRSTHSSQNSESNARNFNYMLAALEPRELVGTRSARSLESSESERDDFSDGDGARIRTNTRHRATSHSVGEFSGSADGSHFSPPDGGSATTPGDVHTPSSGVSSAFRPPRQSDMISAPSSAVTIDWDAASFCASDYVQSGSDLTPSE